VGSRDGSCGCVFWTRGSSGNRSSRVGAKRIGGGPPKRPAGLQPLSRFLLLSRYLLERSSEASPAPSAVIIGMKFEGSPPQNETKPKRCRVAMFGAFLTAALQCPRVNVWRRRDYICGTSGLEPASPAVPTACGTLSVCTAPVARGLCLIACRLVGPVSWAPSRHDTKYAIANNEGEGD